MLAQLNFKPSAFAKQDEYVLYYTVTGIILFLGTVLRLFHYVYNRSLWTDEIYLSAGIVEMSFAELISNPLPHLQKAPLGYLLISHLFVVLFGNDDMVLRLCAMLTGIGSLFLFLPVARHFLKPLGVLVALAIVAFAPPLVCYSVEAKPYSTDLFITTLLLWSYIRYGHQTKTTYLVIWGLWGSLVVWLSYPSIFVLAGIALTVSISHLKRRGWKMIFQLAIPFSMWAASFLLSYVLFAREGSDAKWLYYFFVKYNGYLPLSPVSGAIWLGHRIFSFFHNPLGLTWINDLGALTNMQRFIRRMGVIPFILASLGVLYFLERRRKFLLLVGITIAIGLIVSALKIYPFHERMTVYLAPFIIILVAGGCDYLVRKNNHLKLLGYGLAILLLFGPIKNSIAQVIQPYLFSDYKKSYYRDALQYVDDNYQEGDGVYVYWNGVAGCKYYKATDKLKFNALMGKDYRHSVGNYSEYFARLDAELNSLPNKNRVWIIYSIIDMNQGDYAGEPVWYYNGNDFRVGYGVEQFRRYLLRKGKIIETYAPNDGNTKPDVHVSLMAFK